MLFYVRVSESVECKRVGVDVGEGVALQLSLTTMTTMRSHKAAFDLHNLDLMLFVSVCVCVWVRVHCSYFARVVFLACFSLCSCSCCCCCKFSLAHTDALPKENENKSENKTRLKAENAIEFGFLLKPCRAVPCRASRCVELQTNRM